MINSDIWSGGGIFDLECTDTLVCKTLKKEYDVELFRRLLENEFFSLKEMRALGLNVPKVFSYVSTDGLCQIKMERILAKPNYDVYLSHLNTLLTYIESVALPKNSVLLEKEWYLSVKNRILLFSNICPSIKSLDYRKFLDNIQVDCKISLILDDWNWENFLFDPNNHFHIIDNRIKWGDRLYNVAGIMVANSTNCFDISRFSIAERYRIFLYVLLHYCFQFEQKKAVGFSTYNIERKIVMSISAINQL